MRNLRHAKLLVAFFKALWLAARYSIHHEGFRTVLAHAWGILSALARFALHVDARASKELLEQRLEKGCFQCPIFCEQLQTCGDARQLDDKDPLGCHCFMPVKARLKDSTCWLREPEQAEALKGLASIGSAGWPQEATA